MPGAGAEQRRVAAGRPSRAARAGRTRSSAVQDSSRTPPPSRRRPPRSRLRPRPRDGVRVGAAGVQPAGHRRRDRVHRRRARPATLPMVATQPCASAAAAGRPARRSGERRASRPGGPPAGWCRRGWPRRGSRCRQRPCGQMSVPTATGWPRSTSPRPCSTCSSTNAPTRPQRLRVRTEVVRDRGRPPASASAMVTPSASVSAAGPVGGQRAGDHPRPGAGHAEPGALLVDEVHHPDRPGRPEALGPQRVHRGERADHAERAVVRAAVGDRVQVRAGHHPGAGSRVRVAPPRPLVAHPVLDQVQPAGGALSRRTTPAARRPRRSRRTGGSRRCAGRGRRRSRPTTCEAEGELTPSTLRLPSRIGIRTPRSSAATSVGPVVAGVDVADDAHAGVVGQHPRRASAAASVGAVGQRHLTGVDASGRCRRRRRGGWTPRWRRTRC